jgi:hypothetical protein
MDVVGLMQLVGLDGLDGFDWLYGLGIQGCGSLLPLSAARRP